MARTYEYAVLRLEPNPLRAEAVNLGVVVFRDNDVDIRFGRVLTRARAIMPDFNPEILNQITEAYERLGQVDLSNEEKHRTLSRIGIASLGERKSFIVPSESVDLYEAKVQEILGLFVGEKRAENKRRVGSKTLIADIRNDFRKFNVLAAVGDVAAIMDHRIVPEWPIPNRPSLKADLALKNGDMRVCEVVELNLEENNTFPNAFYSGVVTLEQSESLAKATQRVFAYRAKGSKQKIDEALEIAGMHATKIVDLAVKQQRRDFIDEWVSAAQAC